MVEIIKIKNEIGKTLVGDFYCGNDKNKVVILCHGFMSSRSRNGKYIELAKKLVCEGINVFSFDLTGYGDSDSENISINSGVIDLKCILSYVKSQGYKNVGIVGHSLGGIITIKQNLEEVKSICLLAPVTDKITYSFEDRFGKEKIDEMSMNGFMKIIDKAGKVFNISKELFNERKSVNQKELMKNVKIPCYFIHGTNDNMIPYEHSENALKCLYSNSKIDVIEGENHSLGLNLYRTNKLVVEWFKETL